MALTTLNDNTAAGTKQPMSMADYANSILASRAAESQNKYDSLASELKNAIPAFSGVSSGDSVKTIPALSVVPSGNGYYKATANSNSGVPSGYSTKDDFNPAVRSGQDPLSTEERNKLGVYESYIGKAPTPYEPMKFTEAESLARFRQDPLYEQQLADALKAQNKAAVKTGFYGQLPAEQLKQNASANVEAQRQSGIYDDAMALLDQSDRSAQSAYSVKYQSYRDMMDDLLKDYGLTNDAYTVDWDRNYQTWQEEFDRWWEQESLRKEQELERERLAQQQAIADAQLAWEREQFNAAQAAAAAKGSGSGSGSSGAGSLTYGNSDLGYTYNPTTGVASGSTDGGGWGSVAGITPANSASKGSAASVNNARR
jgi:hypothetical protein